MKKIIFSNLLILSAVTFVNFHIAGAVSTAPTLRATSRGINILLDWDPPSFAVPPVTGYRIYRGAVSGEETLLTPVGADVHTYKDVLRSGKRYYYKISAVSDEGEGDLGNEATALTWNWITVSGSGGQGESCQSWLSRTGQLVGTEPIQIGQPYIRVLDIANSGQGYVYNTYCQYQMPTYWNWCGIARAGASYIPGCGYYRTNNMVSNFVEWRWAQTRFYPIDSVTHLARIWSKDFTYNSDGLGALSTLYGQPSYTQILKDQRGYLFTASITGSGGTGRITGLGIDCGTDCRRYFDQSFGAATFTATSDPDSVFVQWSGSACNGSTNPQCTINVGSGSTNLTANFRLKDKYELTVVRAGAGTGTVSGSGINCGADCSELYITGTTVTLSASASGGSTFSGWSSCDSVTSDNECVVTVNASRIVVANFKKSFVPTQIKEVRPR